MKTVTLQVATLEEVKRRAQDAFRGKKQGVRISFTTPELLFRLMTAKRWELIRSMVGAGPLTIRKVARRVDRNVKAVHGDVHALLKAGILQKTDGGLIADRNWGQVFFLACAGVISVCAKSSPLNSSGSPMSFASA